MTWEYYGDINIEHGGMFVDLEEFAKWKDFCPIVKVTDLDGAIGFEGAIMIERGSVYIPEDPIKRKSALDIIGTTFEEASPLDIVYAFDAYGGVEQDLYNGLITIQADKEGPMEFEGWKADKDYTDKYHASGLSLKEFIEREFVR